MGFKPRCGPPGRVRFGPSRRPRRWRAPTESSSRASMVAHTRGPHRPHHTPRASPRAHHGPHTTLASPRAPRGPSRQGNCWRTLPRAATRARTPPGPSCGPCCARGLRKERGRRASTRTRTKGRASRASGRISTLVRAPQAKQASLDAGPCTTSRGEQATLDAGAHHGRSRARSTEMRGLHPRPSGPRRWRTAGRVARMGRASRAVGPGRAPRAE